MGSRGRLMFLIIFDERLQRDVISVLGGKSDAIERIYNEIKRWIEEIYLEDYDLPAKFASKVFIGDFWDFSMEVRVPAALFQLLIDVMRVPLWVSWADMELGSDIIRLVILYSSRSKVTGIPGKVIVAQFSDDDRVINLTYEGKGKKIAVPTLLGGVAILYTIKEIYMREGVDISQIISNFNQKVSKIINEIKEKREQGELTDLESELTGGS